MRLRIKWILFTFAALVLSFFIYNAVTFDLAKTVSSASHHLVSLLLQAKDRHNVSYLLLDRSSLGEARSPIGIRRRKKILIYTPLFGVSPWGYIPYNYNFTEEDGTFCDVYDCDVTYRKEELRRSDLVVLYGRDLPSLDHLKQVTINERPSNQSWLFYMHESPIFTFFDTKSHSGIFNWTASYRADSDITITYHFYKPLEERDVRPKAGHNFAKGKSKLVTWVNSHCDGDRVDLVSKLREYVEVDVYGGCSKRFKPQTPDCPRRSKKCKDIQSQYKFFLAIENSFCKDYITEKYWLNSLEAGLVPVVLGSGDYYNSKLAIQGSFIDMQKFKSAKDVAEYLKYLDKNDTAYNEYHQWRYKYKLYKHNCMCEFCRAAHDFELPRKTVNLEDFWGKKTCDMGKKPLKSLIENN